MASWRKARCPLTRDAGAPRVRVWNHYGLLWVWECSFCEPPYRGCRSCGNWHKIFTLSLPHHFERRRAHHELTARRRRAL